MNIDTRGLIVKEQKVNEKDRLVTVITENEGLIRAFVKRANSINNKNIASTGLLCFSRLSLYKGRDTYIINEANAIEFFLNLRKDIEKLALAQYFSEIIMELLPQKSESKEFLNILLNALYLLANEKRKPEFIKAVIEIKTLSISGFMPNLICCNNCKKYQDSNMYFSFKKGIIVCEKCYNDNILNINKNCEDYFSLPYSVVTALRYIIYKNGKEIFNFKLSDNSLNIISNIAEQFINFILDKKLKALDFYKQIKSN